MTSNPNWFPGTEGTHYAGVAIPAETEPELVQTFVECERCEGKGSVIDDWPRRANKPGEEQVVTCPKCDGAEELVKEVMTCCGLSDYDCRCVSLG